MSNPFTTKDSLFDIINQVVLGEKKLTDAELKKREEIAQAMERENPGMDMSKKMAIATAQAKKVAEEVELDEAMKPFTDADHDTAAKHGDKIEKNIEHIKKVPTKHLQYLHHHNMGYSGGGGHEDPHLPHIKAELKKRGAKPLSHTEGEKLFNESLEQIDEVGNTLKGQIGLRDYKEKAKKDMGDAGEKLWYKSVTDKDIKGKMALIRQRDKRRKGIQRADARIEKAGGNLDEHLENFWEAYTTMFNEAEDQQQNLLLRAMAKDTSDLMKMKRAIKMGDKALTNPALRQEILKMLDQMMTLTTGDKSLLQRTRMGFQKAKTLPEEVELDEANKPSPTHYHSANLRHKQKQKLTSDHVVTSTGHVVHKTTRKVVGHVKKDSVVRRRHGGLASYDKDTHGQIPATHKPATSKPAATTDNKDDGPLGRAILSYPKPKRTIGEALVAIGDKPRPKPATHIFDKPGHPLHGKPVSIGTGEELRAHVGPHGPLSRSSNLVYHEGKPHHITASHNNFKPIRTEEVQLEAIGAKDKQDEGEYGYEGDMAMSQLRTIIRNCQEMMKVLDKETDMPEWVQSKITLATDYLQTANDYLMSELEEEFELDEADEKEVGKEIKAARLKKDSSEFMSKSSLFSGGARDVAKHLGKKDDEKYGEAMRKVKDTPVSKFVASRKGDGKVRTEEAEKAPFEGGREVKSSKSAAERVKKIAKGMEKLNTPKDKK